MKETRKQFRKRMRARIDGMPAGSKSVNILIWFFADIGKPVKVPIYKLSTIFGSPSHPHFVGFQWARRMREFAAEGFLVSHPDPKDANACHSWSVAQ